MSDGDRNNTSALPRPRRRRRWVTVLLVLAIFGAGFVAGAGTTVVAIVRRLQQMVHDPRGEPGRIAARLRKRLKLDDGQTVQVLAILTEQQERFLAIRREVQPRLAGELERAYRRIAEVLDARQKAKWDRLFHDLRRKWLPEPPPPRAPPAAGSAPGGG